MRESLLLELEKKLAFLVSSYSQQKEQLSLLEEANKALKQKLKEQTAINSKIKESNELLQVANAMMGGKEYRKLMKWKINFLIKSIDRCIDQLKV